MTGDGIMGLFGAPIALEDAPQRAIRSALAIHWEMARFNEQLQKEGKSHPAPSDAGRASTPDRSWSGPWAMTCGWISRSWATR